MGKNRTIPFGYTMRNGVIETEPTEVLAVLTIFSEYMAGRSLNEIAREMAVPYSEGATWNKNMVKRVLENEKYLGTEIYPQLISEDVFRAVNERKTAKATSLCIVPNELQAVRSLTVCKECSKRLFRTKAELWDCRNHDCHPYLFKLTDEMLTSAILNILNTVIANPTLIEAEAPVSEYSPTSETTFNGYSSNQATIFDESHKHSFLLSVKECFLFFDFILKILTRCAIIYKKSLYHFRGDVNAQNCFM